MRINLSRWVPVGFLASLLLVGPAVAQKPGVPAYDRNAPLGDAPPVPAGTEEGEVEARGPVHEAFAQPSEFSLKPTLVAPKEPPPLVEEIPPEEKPAGDNVLWIPGYWSWDEDRADYTWVSGCWRVAPAGRKWVPGYWNKADSGYQWVSGFWADAAANDVPYLDSAPPASLDRGPSIPAPDENNFYVPGTWLYRESRYQWRPGYWSPERPGLVYMPPRYCWTPAGCVFVNGYWDTPLESRGILFAPVVFPRRLYTRTNWTYVPRWTVPAPTLISSLWVRPGVGYYAFGDYYGARYSKLGFHPWITWPGRFRDPLFTWYRGVNRRNPAWERGLAATYRGRLNGFVARPPRTLAAQRITSGARVVRPLGSFRSSAFRLTRVTAPQRAAFRKSVSGFRNTGVARFRSETRVGGGGSRGSFVRNVPGSAVTRVARVGGGSVRRGGVSTRSASHSFSTHRQTARSVTRGAVTRGSVSRGSVSHGSISRGSVTRRATTARSTTSRGTTTRSTSARTGRSRAAASRSSTVRSGSVKSSTGRAAAAHRSVSRGASSHTTTRKSSSAVRHSTTRKSGHR